MILTDEQIAIINATEPKICVLSGAGSAKTFTIVERIKKIVADGVPQNQIVAITFTNTAAEEMRVRLYKDNIKDVFIGTIHSFAYTILKANKIGCKEYILEEEYDEMFRLIEDNYCKIPLIEHIFIDESHDLSKAEAHFIFEELYTVKNYFLVGDLRQRIYSFKNGNTDILFKILKSGEYKVYTLTNNFRCGKNIIEFANKFVQDMPFGEYLIGSYAASDNEGKVVEKEYCDEEYLLNMLYKYNDYHKWAILCRTNEQIVKVMKILKENNVPCITFKRSDTTIKQFQKNMQENAVKVMTAHAAKGLEFDNVMCLGMRYKDEEELRISYVAATRAKYNLIWFWNSKTLFGKSKNYFKNNASSKHPAIKKFTT